MELLTSVVRLYFMNQIIRQNKLLLRNDGNFEFNKLVA